MEALGDDRHGRMGPVYTADPAAGREVIPRLSRGLTNQEVVGASLAGNRLANPCTREYYGLAVKV